MENIEINVQPVNTNIEINLENPITEIEINVSPGTAPTQLYFGDLVDYPADLAGVLTNDGAGNLSWEAGTGITDHTDLSNIGTNTHAQIDSHINDSTIHFTQGAISIPASQISDFDTEVANNTAVALNTLKYTTSEVDALLDGITGVDKIYTDFSTMIADFANQKQKNLYYIGDASGDPDLTDATWALYLLIEKVPSGDPTKYLRIQSLEENGVGGTSHDAVTVVDSSEIDFTLTGQEITASLITGSIDVLKLDAGVQASLGLADTALQSFTETNDLTSAVTWANVPNANITQSSVTQHQAALSITESQISDLSHFTPSTLLADYGFTDNSTNWNTAFGWGNHALAGYVDKTGTPLNNQIAVFTDENTIEGVSGLTFDNTELAVDGVVAIGGTSATGILHVGDSVSTRSSDPVINMRHTFTDANGTGNAHGISDSNIISRGGDMAYAGFDARFIVQSGAEIHDHFAGFQSAMLLDTSGLIDNVYNYFAAGTINVGSSVTNAYGIRLNDWVGSGTIANNYGIWVNNVVKGSTNNWAIRTNGGMVEFVGTGANGTDIGQFLWSRTSASLGDTQFAQFKAASVMGAGIGSYFALSNRMDLKLFGTSSGTKNTGITVKYDGTVWIGSTPPDAATSNELTVNGSTLATSFVTDGGTASQFVKGDGSLDSNTYLTSVAFADITDYPTNAVGALTNDGAGNLSWTATGGSGATQLNELSDVVSATNTNRFALMANGTTGYVGRALVEADISDLQSYLLNIVEDTTPQLGGNLDVLGNSIIDSGATNLALSKSGSGDLSLTNSGSGDLILSHSGAGVIIIGGNTYPEVTGTNAQVLTTDGAGTLTWETIASGVTDHTALSNIGTNTHAQIDSHIADVTLHFTQASISITESQISDLGTYSTDIHANITALNAVSGTNTGDQTSIVGITGTKAQFDTALTDGNFMYIGDAPTSHTHPASEITDFDTEVSNNASVVANTAKVSNIAHPLVETAVPLGAVFTDTIYDDTAIQAEVDLNTAKVGVTTELKPGDIDTIPKINAILTFGSLITDAESTGLTYGRKDGAWTIIEVPTLSKGVTIPLPEDTDDATIFFTPVAITITDVRSHLVGTTNVVFNIQHAATRTGTGLDVFTSNITLTSTAGQSNNSGFNDATIPANSWVWLNIATVSGTPDVFHATIIYTED